jgi:hypothetical protein
LIVRVLNTLVVQLHSSDEAVHKIYVIRAPGAPRPLPVLVLALVDC